MPRELPDRRHSLFGREPDLAALIERVQWKGLTAIVARPQMGKSWLLIELARRLSTDHESRHIVGVAESVGQTPDLLLRAIVDLYERWLSDADYREQAKMVWDQQKSNLLPGVAKTVGKIFKELAELAKPVGTVVEDAINGLVAANQSLTTGGIQLPALQYDQARDLVRAVAETARQPVALVLDQWEKSPDAAFEAKTLNAFLHHLDDWPRCHLFMALRPDEPAHGEVERLARSLPGTAEMYRLDEMELGAGEGHRLTAFVRGTVPAALGQSDENLLGLIEGYPGVLYQWTRDYQRAHMQTLGDLERVSKDAENYRFSELNDLLPKLDGAHRTLALRLVLLPPGGEGFWQPLKTEVLDGLSEHLTDDLKIAEVLDSSDPPGFGYVKRWEAACAWFVENRSVATRLEAESLVLRVAARIEVAEPKVLPHIAFLASFLPSSEQLALNNLSKALCHSAITLLGISAASDEAMMVGGRQARRAGFEAVAPLLAMGLLNALNAANGRNDLRREDVLLNELRMLAKAHPEKAAVQEQLAKGLHNRTCSAEDENDLTRRDAMLLELRALATAHPENPAVQEQLAKGLFNTVLRAKNADDFDRRNDLLDELRALAKAHPENTVVGENLAKGLFDTVSYAKVENDVTWRDALLKELRRLASEYHESAGIRAIFAKTLVNALNHAKDEDNLIRRDALREELRRLASAYPTEAAVNDALAAGLYNILNHAQAENDLARRDTLLGELGALAKAHPKDAAVRKRLAMSLFNTLVGAKAKDDLEQRDALLDEMRALAEAQPEDPVVRERLAGALYNTRTDAKAEGDADRRDALLDELRFLAATHSEDAAVREHLAKGLCNTLNDAKEEDDLDRRDDLLDELRALAKAHPEDAAVREPLARGLVNTLNHALAENNLGRRDALLDELRTLAHVYPKDEAVHEILASTLLNTLNRAKAEDDQKRRDALLEELRSLVAEYFDEAVVRECLAKGLAKTMLDAADENQVERAEQLREELRALAAAYPDDGWVERLRSAGLL